MEQIYLKARAKINLALDVLGKREDGYHDLRMILQTLELCDDVLIRKTDKLRLKVVSNLPWLPCDERNLAYKAADFMLNEYSLPSGLFISLEKRIPVSAGLAGGSSDCAAVLVGLRNMFGLDITDAELMTLGKRFGADVPYCVMRGTALAEGIGERLTRLAPHPPVYVLLARPPFSVSTQAVFRSFDNAAVELSARPDVDKMMRDIKNGNLPGIASGLTNVLESVTLPMHPEIAELKQIMRGHGALGTLMSGSGPAIFGYFTGRSDALRAMAAVKERPEDIKSIFLTQLFNVHTKSPTERRDTKWKTGLT